MVVGLRFSAVSVSASVSAYTASTATRLTSNLVSISLHRSGIRYTTSKDLPSLLPSVSRRHHPLSAFRRSLASRPFTTVLPRSASTNAVDMDQNVDPRAKRKQSDSTGNDRPMNQFKLEREDSYPFGGDTPVNGAVNGQEIAFELEDGRNVSRVPTGVDTVEWQATIEKVV